MNSEWLDMGLHVLLQGSIYSLVVMGVYLSSRVLKFDDLTTEGSFGVGGAITAATLVAGGPGWAALLLSSLGGAAAGILTGLLHTRLKMNNLICGLIVTTALFSVCLKWAGANLSLPDVHSVFSGSSRIGALIGVGSIAAVVCWGLQFALRSEIGLIFRALGSNPQIVVSLGKSVDAYKIVGLAAANTLTALAGALFVQWNGFYSITGNVGTLVIGLTGLILGEMIRPSFGFGLIAGAILVQGIFAVTLEFELEPLWNHLIKAVLIVILIQIKPNRNFSVAR